MTKKAWILIGGGAVVILAIVISALLWKGKEKPLPAPAAYQGVGPENVPSPTRLEVPAGTEVPGSASAVDANVAKPTAVTVAAPGAATKFRVFDISINANQFSPNTVIVNAGDIAHINFTAVDRSYDITQPDYGFKLNLAQGEKKVLEGQFNSSGKYIFYCASCGGPDRGPVGYVVVVSK